MTEQTVKTLETHYHLWDTLQKAGYVKHLPQEIKNELHDAFHELVDQYEHVNLWCGECVADMVRRVFTRYDALNKKANEQKPPASEPTLTVETPAEPKPVKSKPPKKSAKKG